MRDLLNLVHEGEEIKLQPSFLMLRSSTATFNRVDCVNHLLDSGLARYLTDLS